VYAFEHATETWREDAEELELMPYGIDYAGAMAYERKNHGRLFVASDEDVEGENYLNVYTFNNTWGLDGHWNDPELQAPIALPERIGPGVALAFQPSNNLGSLLSGFLYLIPGGGTSTLYRRAFNLVNWTPDGLGPGNGAAVTLDSLEFDWSTRVGASYEIQVARTPDFRSPVISLATTEAEFCPPRGRLPRGGPYYWRARFVMRGRPSEWGETRSFTLTSEARPREARTFPAEGTLMSGDNVAFDWPSALRAVRYQLQVARSPDFGAPVINAEVTPSEYTARVPLPSGRYYWRTRWQAASGEWSEWSATSSFETNYGWQTLPSKPDASIWEGGAMCYVIDRENPPVEALYVLVGNGEQEFWRFNLGSMAWERREDTPVPQTWGASLTSRHVWHSSRLLSALMGGEDTTLWEYDIRDNAWGPDGDGTPLPRACGGGSCIVRDEGDYYLTLVIAGEYLPPPTNFYKRVPSPEEDGPMASGLSRRRVESVRLSWSAGEARLSYVLGSPGTVRAVVFDAAGRRVRTLFSEQQAAGEHSLVWDLADANGRRVRAGVHFVALDSDGTRTMLKVPVW